jgi:phospholipase D3/4
VLISKWAHTNARISPALAALQAAASSICTAPDAPAYLPKCGPGGTGSLEVRLFEVPGWNQTESPNAAYPPYSRVNHAKYIVTDNRVNIGTSNMAWG